MINQSGNTGINRQVSPLKGTNSVSGDVKGNASLKSKEKDGLLSLSELSSVDETRNSRVETIVDEDDDAVNFTYTAEASDEKESLRDGLIFTLGCQQVLKPIKIAENQYKHELSSVDCLNNKHIIFYITAKRFQKESYRRVKVKQRLTKLIESLETNVEADSTDFAVVVLSRDTRLTDFTEVIKDTPFYAIPFEKKETIETLISFFHVDSALWYQKASRVIVYDVKKRSVITYWGKLGLALNSDSVCLENWRQNLSGITVRKWMGLLSLGTNTEN